MQGDPIDSLELTSPLSQALFLKVSLSRFTFNTVVSIHILLLAGQLK